MTGLQKRLKVIWQKLEKPQHAIEKLLIASWTLALLMVALSLLTGCSYFAKPQPAIPANLAVPCADIAPFDGQTLGDLMEYTVDVISLYHECQSRMDAVGAWADRA
jgi:hypothetical protein